MNKIRHIAIIPDGNRRWARKKGLPVFLGHKKGADNIKIITRAAFDMGVKNLTIWGASYNNVTERSADEVKDLFEIFEKSFKKLLSQKIICKESIRIRILGRWRDVFSPALVKLFEKIEKETRDYKNYNLTFMMAYNGTDEMVEAVKRVVRLKEGSPKLKINGDLIKNNLWTKDLPPVDLVIRTGGEPHWSVGFMMWDTADARFYFTETFWPAFSAKEFKKAISSVEKVEKRGGK